MSDKPQRTILVCDDDEVLRSRMEKAFSKRGLHPLTADCYDRAIEVVRAQRPDFAVIDLKMPGPNGMTLLRDLLAVSPHTRVVILTGYGSIANAVEAVKMGAVNYVTKPADADQILSALNADAIGALNAELNDLSPPSLAEAQWEHIQRVLADCKGNISEAARRLDIPRRTLQRKLKKMAP